MPSRSRENALSEVIGFILILALIAALASLYLTYVVPAQGREGEIKHMAEINDQFLGYKAAVDSLWINDQTNVPISRTFTLGTLTGTTQGSFVIPIFQPYPSSGSMAVNGRGETITINADALVQGFPGSATPNLNPVYYEPNHLYVKVMTQDVNQSGGIFINSNSGNWSVWINSTKSVTPSNIIAPVTPLPTLTYIPGNQFDQIERYIRGILVPWSNNVSSLSSFRSDLTITMIKHQNKTFNNLIIQKSMENYEYYLIDLLDPTYGLSPDLIYPFSLNIQNTSPWFYHYPVKTGYNGTPITITHPMGSLEFQSNNKYWIQQNYYYQQGGVFLEQPGDGMVAKVMPLISISNETGIPSVKILDIVITPVGQSNIGGTSPVQVVTTLNDIHTENLARGFPNARNVTLIIDTDAVPVWNQIFTWIKNNAEKDGKNPGVDESLIQIIPGTNSIQLTMDTSPEYGLYFDYTRVNLSVELQPVAT